MPNGVAFAIAGVYTGAQNSVAKSQIEHSAAERSLHEQAPWSIP